MTDRTFVLDLARLVVAAAWADGELKNEEINSLKDLLFGLEEVSGKEWKSIEMYMNSPPSPEQTEQLAQKVLSSIRSEQDRTLVLNTLEKLFAADGVVSEEERDFLDKLRGEMEATPTGFMQRFVETIKRALGKRAETPADDTAGGNLDDYIRNRIYHELKRRGEAEQLELPAETIKKLCLAGGLMAMVGAVDSQVSPEEAEQIEQILQEQWDISRQQAHLVAVAATSGALGGLDYYRLVRGLYECTNYQERKDFLKCLFQVANASDKTSRDETEQIRQIAYSLKLNNRDFIEAKLTVPDSDREVL